MKILSIIYLSLLLFIAPAYATFFDFLNDWSSFNKKMREETWSSWVARTEKSKKIEPDEIDNPLYPTNSHKLSDIKGVVPQQIYDIRDYLQGNAEHFKQAGAQLPTGILLIGKPGTGKTSIARALANELDAPFLTAKASDFIEIYVGTGPKKIRELFQKARDEIKKTKAPFAIIFIDELDAIGSRDQRFSISEENRTITELLAQMDGFSRERNIIVIAATNHRDLIDSALLRPGRFEEIIEIPLPDLKTRLDILNHFLHAPSFKRSVDEKINLTLIAQQTDGWSGADLESLVNQAAIITARARRTTITQEDLDSSYRQKKSMRH